MTVVCVAVPMASYIKPCVTKADPHVSMPESVSVVVTTREDNVVSPLTDNEPPIVALAVIETAVPVLVKELTPVKALVPAKVGTAETSEALATLAAGRVTAPRTVKPPLADNNPPTVALLVIAIGLVLLKELTPVKALVPATVGTAETSDALATLAAGRVTAPRTVNPPDTSKEPPMVQLFVTAIPTPGLLKVFVPDKVGTGDTNDAFAMLAEGSEMAPVTVNPLDALIEEQTMADPEVKVPLVPLEPVEPIGPV